MEQAAWLWGGCGAFLYAAPKLIGCLQPNHEEGWRTCVGTFLVAMAFGPIFAESFGPWIGYRWGWLVLPDARALYVTIGLSANSVAPLLVRAVRGHVVKFASPKEEAQ